MGMQAFCSGQILSGVIKAIILAGISVLTGYLIIGLGNPIYLFLIGAFAIALVALSGGLADLGVGVMQVIFNHVREIAIFNTLLNQVDP